jgi:hypothetical protein
MPFKRYPPGYDINDDKVLVPFSMGTCCMGNATRRCRFTMTFSASCDAQALAANLRVAG